MTRARIFLLLVATAVLVPAIPALSQAQPNPPPSSSPDTTSVVSGEETPEWQARLELGALLGNVGRYPEAIEQYEQVLKEKPDSMKALSGLAQMLYRVGEPKKAMAVMDKAPEAGLGPEERLLLADLHRSLKHYPEAERLYRSHLDAQPEDHLVRYKLAALLSWMTRYEDSIAEYETILAARPEDAQLRRKYAQVLTWAGRNEEAMVQWQKTLDH